MELFEEGLVELGMTPSQAVVAADFNGDRKPDLAIANEAGGTALTGMFNARGQDIITSMTTMQNTMEKMGDAFTAALRTYLDHEHMSRSDLDRIGSMSNVTPFFSIRVSSSATSSSKVNPY